MKRFNLCHGFVFVLFTLVVTAGAAESTMLMEVIAVSGGRAELLWPTTASAALESSPTLGGAAVWTAAPEAVEDRVGFRVVTVTPSTGARFFRLASRGPDLVRVLETSPRSGESGVAVTRETVFRLSGPLAVEQVVSTTDMSATANGRLILSRVELGSDRKTLTLFYLENLPSGSKVTVASR